MAPAWNDEQWNDIVDLLTYIAAADRRTVGQTDVRVWLDAARDGQWPSIDFAYRAVIRHRNEQPGRWLEPGHITQILKQVRAAANAAFNEPRVPDDVLAGDAADYQRWLRGTVAAHHEQFIHDWATGDRDVPLQIGAGS